MGKWEQRIVGFGSLLLIAVVLLVVLFKTPSTTVITETVEKAVSKVAGERGEQTEAATPAVAPTGTLHFDSVSLRNETKEAARKAYLEGLQSTRKIKVMGPEETKKWVKEVFDEALQKYRSAPAGVPSKDPPGDPSS